MRFRPALTLVAASVPLVGYSDCGGTNCPAVMQMESIEFQHAEPIDTPYSLRLELGGVALEAACPGYGGTEALDLRCDASGFTVMKPAGAPWGSAPADAESVPVELTIVYEPGHLLVGKGEARISSHYEGDECVSETWGRTLELSITKEVTIR